jgi:hypothetical protein
MLKPTRLDPNNELTFSALAYADFRRELWHRRALLVRAAFDTYGDHGPLISGCERDHFPAPVKRMLQRYAVAQGDASDTAYSLWRSAGRRARTLRAIVQGTGEPFAFNYR